MNDKEFKTLYKEMRSVQKAYFKAKQDGTPYEECQSLLQQSKALERRCDAEADREEEPSLF